MKTFIISLILLVLPIVAHAEVYITGTDLIKNTQSAILTAHPEGIGYTYAWDFEQDWDKIEDKLNVAISGNTISISAKPQTKSMIVWVYCTVYDGDGISLGSAEFMLLITEK